MYFVSKNVNKYNEIKELLLDNGLTHLRLEHKKIELKEIQSNFLDEVATVKVKQAFELFGEQVLIEDDGLFIESLNGFPGVYSSFVYDTLGNNGILDLLKNKTNRKAVFKSVIAFYEGKNIKTFIGEVKGLISDNIQEGGWGFDPIFIPENAEKCFGQMDLNSKNKYSHRRSALVQFYKWYIQNINKIVK
jgi:XTP/dITP diphosphohydrolase